MNTSYSNWLRAQLDLIDCPEPDLGDFDVFRHVLQEAARQAAELGHQDAVRACQVRPGPIGSDTAREALTVCLSALGPDQRRRKHRI